MSGQGSYALERTAGETERLNSQNEIIINGVGFVLHPRLYDPTTSPSPNLRIADLATGPGAFLVSVASLLPPTCKLDGYDISSASFLPSSALPPNIHLTTADAKLPPPEDRRGIYDIICIRFLNVALAPADWPLVARTAATMLKPGGKLQWIEADLSQLRTPLYVNPAAPTTSLRKYTRQFLSLLPHLHWFTEHLAAVLEDAGFDAVQHDVSSNDRDPAQRRAMSMLAMRAHVGGLRQQMMMMSSSSSTPQKPFPGAAKDEAELEQWRREMEEEVQTGAYLRSDMHTFTAIKGSS